MCLWYPPPPAFCRVRSWVCIDPVRDFSCFVFIAVSIRPTYGC